MINTAHLSENVGKYSELAARLALLANGWTVHQAETDEAYDVLAKDPVSGEYAKIQIKTIRQRKDRGGDLVVYAKKVTGRRTTWPTLIILLAYGRSKAKFPACSCSKIAF